MVGLLLKGRRLWQNGSLLSLCCTHQSIQHGDVLLSRASPPGYEGPIAQNEGLLCSCTHQLKVMETLPGDILIDKETLGLFKGGQRSNKNTSMNCFTRCHHDDFSCYPKLFNRTTFDHSCSDALDKTLSKISVFGAVSSLKYSSGFIGSIPRIRKACSELWSQKRRGSPWIGTRSYFSAETYESLSNLESGSLKSTSFRMAATDETEAETNASSSGSDEDFDFRNFPALKSSTYQDYERPSEMQRKKRVAWQTGRKQFNTDSKLTLESIPQPKGRTYDFGFGDMFSKPPPLEAGARPQGGFDIDICLDECEEAPSQRLSSFPIFPQRMPSCKLPLDTPEADNWSEISTDSQDSISKHEPELCWDPYDFDASVRLPQIEENLSANVPAQ